MNSILSFLLLSLLAVFTNAHTIRICSVITNSTVQFYAGTYHSIAQAGKVGGIIVDGIRHNFTETVLPAQANIPANANCSYCSSYSPAQYPIGFYQKITVTGLSDGNHTVSTSCDTVVECPGCVFAPITIIGIKPIPTTAVPTTPVPTTAVPTTPVPTTAVRTTPVPTTATPTTSSCIKPTTACPSLPALTLPITCPTIPPTTVPSTTKPITAFSALNALLVKINIVMSTYDGELAKCLTQAQVLAMNQLATANCWPTTVSSNLATMFSAIAAQTPNTLSWAAQIQLLIQSVELLVWPVGAADFCYNILTLTNDWNTILTL